LAKENIEKKGGKQWLRGGPKNYRGGGGLKFKKFFIAKRGLRISMLLGQLRHTILFFFLIFN